MSKRLKQDVESVSSSIKEDSIQYASSTGLQMNFPHESTPLNVHAPLSILPNSIPRTSWERGVAMSIGFNKLVDRVSRDNAWLFSNLEGVLDGDDFTAKLVDIWREHGGDKTNQKVYLGVHRSDYMLDKPNKDHPKESVLLQVELNTIASSFGCLASRVTAMHRHTLPRYLSDNTFLRQHYQLPKKGEVDWLSRMPENEADANIVLGMATAAEEYMRQHALSQKSKVVVVFVVQPGETNAFDQKHLEYKLWVGHGFKVCVQVHWRLLRLFCSSSQH